MLIAWGSKVSVEFKAKIIRIAEGLGTQPDYLMALMSFQSGLNPAARNRVTNAAGLFQFPPGILTRMGTSIQEFLAMSGEQQLDYGEKFFTAFKGRISMPSDLYMALFWPAAVGKPIDLQPSHLPRRSRTRYVNSGLRKAITDVECRANTEIQ